MRGCFIANNSSTIPFNLVGAIQDVDRIGDYDYGSFTLAIFLHEMRLLLEGVTDDWLGFYSFLLVSHLDQFFDSLNLDLSFSMTNFFLSGLTVLGLREAPLPSTLTILGLDSYTRGHQWHQSTLVEVPIFKSFTHPRLQLELLSASDIVWVPYTIEQLAEGFEDGLSIRLKYYLSIIQIPFLFDGGWEVYIGECAVRYITGKVHLPFLPLP